MSDPFIRTRLLIGDDPLDRLSRAKVAVFGVGGVGGFCVEALARAAQIYGSGVVIRVPNEEAARVAQMMDCQLQGIKIPHVETKEQALAIVNAVKYAPVGTRGFCPITRAADYGFTASPADYPVRANRDSVVSIMVETKRGLENLDEILSIPEIDVVAIGPSDVSASYGLPGGQGGH